MEPSQDFKASQERIQKSLVSVVKSVNRIAAEDLVFQRTVNPDVGEQLDDQSTRILGLSTRLLRSAARACGLKAPPKLEEGEDIEVNWRGIVDVVDTVLEKADTALDEYTGLIKRKEPPTTESSPYPKKAKPAGQVIRNANITKPQVAFELQPDNFSTGPWKPILSKKPHSQKPLEESLVAAPNEQGELQYKHPYETEITNMKYPDRVYQKAEPIPFKPVEGTKATWVDTYDGVLKMLEQLKEAKEIAVDLEHHDFRTYTGIVSLMQISTRDQDWLVDTLKPWRHKLEVLNEVFADPGIIKVFHGAYMDMLWLQRDLGLYVNGLFDTYFACELLAYPARSLAFLLSKFVNFDADKQYQMADWRMRPLPKEMLYYARSDTHYLLYIYDQVRNDLVTVSDRSNPETDNIQKALDRSRELSLSRNVYYTFDEATGKGTRGWYNYVLKHGHMAFDSEQFSCFKALWKWRDKTARKEDEHPNFVLGSNNLSEIARVNPPDMKALHSLLPPTAPIAKAHIAEIWQYITEAKAEGGPSLIQYLTLASSVESSRAVGSRLSKPGDALPNIQDDVSVDRLASSQLFGSMAISSRWEGTGQPTNAQDDQIPFPWQRFVQQASDGDALQVEEVAPEPSAQPQSAERAGSLMLQEAEADEEFTLKRGKKRKTAPVESESDASDSSQDEEDEEMADIDNGVLTLEDEKPKKRHRNKKERKQERKGPKKAKPVQDVQDSQIKLERARRKAEKKQQRKEKQEKESKYQAVPFDYTKAASVMHANRNQESSDGPAKEPKKVFDPYAKTGDDGLKGARKAPPIRGEKSATFKK